MSKETCSICFDCENAYAHKCRKILDGTPIKGWMVEKGTEGYRVLACPRFQRDRNPWITAEELAKLLGVCIKTVHRTEPHKLIERAREKGYLLKIHVDKTYRSYYIYKI